MIDPVTLAAGAIAKIAFDEFVKAGAKEAATKAVGGAADLIKSLRDKIRSKFQGDKKVETALAQVEQEGSPAALNKLEVYLDDAMTDDPAFADEVQHLAQQIINIENQTVEGNRTYNQNAGRDIFNIEKIEGKINKLGGS